MRAWGISGGADALRNFVRWGGPCRLCGKHGERSVSKLRPVMGEIDDVERSDGTGRLPDRAMASNWSNFFDSLECVN